MDPTALRIKSKLPSATQDPLLSEPCLPSLLQLPSLTSSTTLCRVRREQGQTVKAQRFYPICIWESLTKALSGHMITIA